MLLEDKFYISLRSNAQYITAMLYIHKWKRSGASQVALVVKNPPASAGDTGDLGFIHRWGRAPGVGNGNTLQRKALWPTLHGVTSDATEAIEHTHMHGIGLGKFLRRWPACALSQGLLSWPWWSTYILIRLQISQFLFHCKIPQLRKSRFNTHILSLSLVVNEAASHVNIKWWCVHSQTYFD